MKISKYLIITMAAAMTASGLVVFHAHAAEAQASRRAPGGRLLERAKEKLGLTDEQVAQIKHELAGEKDSLKSLFSRLHESRTNLRQSIQSADANESTVRAASAKVAAVEADVAVERMKLFSKISPILTSEQRDKVKEFQSRVDDFVDGAIDRFGQRLGERGEK